MTSGERPPQYPGLDGDVIALNACDVNLHPGVEKVAIGMD